MPFGRRHRGQTVRQCRDKSWLLWARTIQTLTNKVCFALGKAHGCADLTGGSIYCSSGQSTSGSLILGIMKFNVILVNLPMTSCTKANTLEISVMAQGQK